LFWAGAAIEEAAKEAGHDLQVPFSAGCADVLQEETDVESFAVLEPTADGLAKLRPKRTDWPRVDVQNATGDS
jgi:catalase-peroxidase